MIMSMKEQILLDMKTAMKTRDKEKVSVLRILVSSLKNREIHIRPKELTDQDVLGVLKKLSRQLKDSIEQFQKGNRKDLVEKEQKELFILKEYLPKEMGEDEIKKVVTHCIEELGATGMKDMGLVMQAVLSRTKDTADNRKVSQIVRSLLAIG